eukprot:9132411-Pyramimonas_sp.AAC.1
MTPQPSAGVAEGAPCNRHQPRTSDKGRKWALHLARRLRPRLQGLRTARTPARTAGPRRTSRRNLGH